MKGLRKALAALLCGVVCFGVVCATASGEASDEQARYERLLRFAQEVTAWDDGGFYDDASAYDSSFAYIRAEEYEREKTNAPDYSMIESLYLYGFNQAQFEEILPQVPGMRRLTLANCAVEDYTPLLSVAPRLTLDTSWQPDLLEQLAVLPDLLGLVLDSVPDADLSRLAALTGLEALALRLEGDCAVDLNPLGALNNLKSLELQSWGESSDTLPDMPALKELTLYCGMDVAQLEHTPALEKLYLSGYLSDDLSPLYALPALIHLEINAVHTDVVDHVEELEALHEAMPSLQIVLYYCC